MKICITSDGNSLEANVDPRFGRCSYFIFYDIDANDFEVFENAATSEMGGAGIKNAQLMLEKDVEVILTGNLGPNAANVLNQAGIKVITDIKGKVKDVIEDFKKGILKADAANPTVSSHFGMSNQRQKKQKLNIRVAISTDGDFVSAHFGRCPSFTIVDIENNRVVKKEVIDNPGHHPGQLPEFLYKKNVNAIICGGMGQRALALFQQYGIDSIVGVEGKINEVIEKLLKYNLQSGKSLCNPGSGKNYGLEKTECDHQGG